jgi:hypothetical protein
MKYLVLDNDRVVLKSAYVEAKTKDLIEFGYGSLTEVELSEQVDKILLGDSDLTIIGRFCESDINVDKTNSLQEN